MKEQKDGKEDCLARMDKFKPKFKRDIPPSTIAARSASEIPNEEICRGRGRTREGSKSISHD